jgi:hypothetical protein
MNSSVPREGDKQVAQVFLLTIVIKWTTIIEKIKINSALLGKIKSNKLFLVIVRSLG